VEPTWNYIRPSPSDVYINDYEDGDDDHDDDDDEHNSVLIYLLANLTAQMSVKNSAWVKKKKKYLKLSLIVYIPNIFKVGFSQWNGSRDSSVGIAIGYGTDDWGVGVRIPAESRIFST
jgi:hypothetical protein